MKNAYSFLSSILSFLISLSFRSSQIKNQISRWIERRISLTFRISYDDHPPPPLFFLFFQSETTKRKKIHPNFPQRQSYLLFHRNPKFPFHFVLLTLVPFAFPPAIPPLPLIQPLPSPLIPLPPRSPPASPPHSSPSPLPFLRNREPLSAERGVCLQIRRTYTVAPVCTATLHAEGRAAVAVRQGPGERRTILESYPRLKIFRSFLFSPSFFQRNERISRPSWSKFKNIICKLKNIFFCFEFLYSDDAYSITKDLRRYYGKIFHNDIFEGRI